MDDLSGETTGIGDSSGKTMDDPLLRAMDNLSDKTADVSLDENEDNSSGASMEDATKTEDHSSETTMDDARETKDDSSGATMDDATKTKDDSSGATMDDAREKWERTY